MPFSIEDYGKELDSILEGQPAPTETPLPDKGVDPNQYGSELDSILSDGFQAEPQQDQVSPQVGSDAYDARGEIRDDLSNSDKMLERLSIMNAQSVGGIMQKVANADPGRKLFELGKKYDEGAIPSAWDALSLLGEVSLKGWGDIGDLASEGEFRKNANEDAAVLHKAAMDALGSKELSYSGSKPEKIGWEVIEAAANITPALVVGFASRRPDIPLGVMGMQVAGQKYAEVYQQTGSDEIATKAAVFATLAEVLPETIVVGKLLEKTPAGEGLRKLFDMTVGEGSTEMLTEVLNSVYDDTQLKGMSLSEAIRNIDWEQVGKAGLMGAAVGTTIGAPVEAGRAYINKKSSEIEEKNRALEEEKIRAWEEFIKTGNRQGWEDYLKGYNQRKAENDVKPWWEKPEERGTDQYRQWYEQNTGKKWDDGFSTDNTGEVDPAMLEGFGRDNQTPPPEPPPPDDDLDTIRTGRVDPLDKNASAIDEAIDKAGSQATLDETPTLDEFADMGDAISAEQEFMGGEQGFSGDGRTTGEQADPTGEQTATANEEAAPQESVIHAGYTPDDEVAAKAHEAATSPLNDQPEPTEAQKEAGNYKKGKIKFGGYDISIENPAGSTRRPEWPPLKDHYGYIKRTTGADDEQIDVFIKEGKRKEDGPIVVIDQSDGKGGFDEHKVMMGFSSETDALRGYRRNYSEDAPPPISTRVFRNKAEFDGWLENGDQKRPAAEYQPKKQKPEEPKAEPRPHAFEPGYKGLSGTKTLVAGKSLSSITGVKSGKRKRPAYLLPDGTAVANAAHLGVRTDKAERDLGVVSITSRKEGGKPVMRITLRPGKKLTLAQYEAIRKAKDKGATIEVGHKFKTGDVKYRPVSMAALRSRHTYDADPLADRMTPAEEEAARKKADAAEKKRQVALKNLEKRWWKSAPAKGDLITFIRALGGINTDIESDVRGRLSHLNQQNRAVGLPGIEQKGKGLALDELGQILIENGYLKKDKIGSGVDKDAVIDLLMRAESETVLPEYDADAMEDKFKRDLDEQAERERMIYEDMERERKELGLTPEQYYGRDIEDEVEDERVQKEMADRYGSVGPADWAQMIEQMPPDESALFENKDAEIMGRLFMLANEIDPDRAMSAMEKDITDAEVNDLLREILGVKKDDATAEKETRGRREEGRETTEDQGAPQEAFELTDEVSEQQKAKDLEIEKERKLNGDGKDVPLVQTGDDLFANNGELEPDLFGNTERPEIELIEQPTTNPDADLFVFDLYRPNDGNKLIGADYVKTVAVADVGELMKAEEVVNEKYPDLLPYYATKFMPSPTMTPVEQLREFESRTDLPVRGKPESVDDIRSEVEVRKAKLRQLSKEDLRQIVSMHEAVFYNPDKPVRMAEKAAEQGVLTKEEAATIVQRWKNEAERQGVELASENGNLTVLSLFDATGEWAKPWAEAGYNVVTIDLKTDGIDVMDIDSEWLIEHELTDVHVVLAACPCTDFAVSGARDWKDTKSSRVKGGKDNTGRTHKSIDLVNHTVGIIEYLQPAIWAIENPVGRIAKVTDVPEARLIFDPHHFGDDYTKKTLIYGNFNADLPVANVNPDRGSLMHKMGSKDEREGGLRSVTPEGFSYAFFMANNAVAYPLYEVAADHYERLLSKKDRGDGKLRAAYIAGAANYPLDGIDLTPDEAVAYEHGQEDRENNWMIGIKPIPADVAERYAEKLIRRPADSVREDMIVPYNLKRTRPPEINEKLKDIRIDVDYNGETISQTAEWWLDDVDERIVEIDKLRTCGKK